MKLYLLKFLAFAAVSASIAYEYSEQSKWYDEYPDCNKYRQSPIELYQKTSKIYLGFSDLKFINYNQKYPGLVTLKNNNHTVDIDIPTSGKTKNAIIRREWQTYDTGLPHITGGPLGSVKYVAESVHFHWGSTDSHGTEHVLNGVRNSLEMHVLHRNMKYRSVKEARDYPDGLTVLGILMQATPISQERPGLASISNYINQVTKSGSSMDISAGFTLSNLLESVNTAEYFTYDGSLTTPPCLQTVKWVVFSHVVLISTQQMAQFRSVEDSNGNAIENNYRALQARGDRTVYFRKPILNIRKQ